MYKILIIEDEAFIRNELYSLLENNGYQVGFLTDFQNPIQGVEVHKPDLILLDINLPGIDGFSICSRIRARWQIPIIFITGRDSTMDEIQALALGGDDYITKPYNIPVLLARISALLRRENKGQKSVECLEYRGISLYPIAGHVVYNGRETELSKTELKMMYYFFTHTEQIIPRMDLIEYLWDNDIHMDDNTLSVNVTRLRDKLKQIGIGELIQTKRGMGYKL